MSDDDDFGWHALNYRTAHTVHAQAMWVELEACLQRKIAAAVAAEREAIAQWIAGQRNDVPATGAEFAEAIRKGESQ